MRQIAGIGLLFQLGWVVAFSVLIPLAIGLWIDSNWNTSPLFILVGAGVGIMAATIGVVRIVTRSISAHGQPPEDQEDEI